SNGDIGSIVTTAPFQAKINAKVTGKTAHAGLAPEKGASAITIAAKSIAKMPNGRIDDETTAKIGYFQGGKSTQTNVVVDEVVLFKKLVRFKKINSKRSCMILKKHIMKLLKRLVEQKRSILSGCIQVLKTNRTRKLYRWQNKQKKHKPYLLNY